MILEHFDNLIAGLEAKLQANDNDVLARKRFALEIARLGRRLFAREEPIAWCGVLVPFDLLHALGITSCYAEFIGALLAGTGTVEALLENAEGSGYSTDSCSYHRAVLGAKQAGLVPEPEFLIASTAPCTGGLAVVENLARQFDKDLFVLQIPQEDTPATRNFLAAELRAMVEFVSAHTGVPLDLERLRTAIVNTNRTRELSLEIYALAQTVPTPARPRDLVNFGIVMSLLLGTEAGVQVAQTYRDEFAHKVRAGIPGTANERFRLMWLQNRVQFQNPLEDIFHDGHGAVIVVDELNDIAWDAIDPDDPFVGLAARIMSVCLVGPFERRLQRVRYLAERYRVDGAINPCHWGCRQGTGARGLITSGLRDVGVPVLNLEVDCIDPRNFAEGQVRTRIDAFVEMLAAERGARADKPTSSAPSVR